MLISLVTFVKSPCKKELFKQFLPYFRDLQHYFLSKNLPKAHFYFCAYVVILYLFLIYKDSVVVETLQHYLAKEPFYRTNQYQPITILVARTQCVFSVSLRAGKRLARTTVKRIVISPADKQNKQHQSCSTIRARVIVHVQ